MRKITNPETKKELPLAITENAVKKILEIREKKQISKDYALRLGVKASGCGVASFVIGFDHVSEKDETFQLGNLSIIIEKAQIMYLAGKSVDYGSTNGETGFIFRDGA